MAHEPWKQELLSPCSSSPGTCCLTCCCPSVQFGLNASKVHGDDCCVHCMHYYLASCCALQGLYAGPTRKAIRDAYGLPQVPLSVGQGTPSDFLVHTFGCLSMLALCQEAAELKARNVSDSLVLPFDPFDQHVAVVRKEPPPTVAPKQEEMVAEH